MGAPKVGEIGNIIRIDAGFDMSSNTDLEMVFTDPLEVETTKTSADGVIAPAINVTDPETGQEFLANMYWEYPVESGLINQTGTWNAYGVYIDATPKRLCGDASATSFVVTACGPAAAD